MVLYLKDRHYLSRYKKSLVLRIAIITVIFIVIGVFFYQSIADKINPWLTLQTARGSSFLANMLGYKAYLKGNILNVSGLDVVYIDTPCNGLILFVQFAALIILFPGPVI